MAHREIIHNSKEPTFFTKNDLLGQYVKANGTKNHYLNQLVIKTIKLIFFNFFEKLNSYLRPMLDKERIELRI